MRINLKKQPKEEDIQSILYLGIMFGDIDCISKILHPKGRFMGMSKCKFIYSIKRHAYLGENISEEEDSEIDFTNFISLHRFPGKRCYVLPMKRINGGASGAYVFIMHPDKNKQVGLILETGIFQEEEHFVSSALMYRNEAHEKYDLLFKN